MISRSPFINATSARKQAGLYVRLIEMQGETLFFAEGRQITRLELSSLAGLRLKVIEKNVREQVQIVSEAFGGRCNRSCAPSDPHAALSLKDKGCWKKLMD